MAASAERFEDLADGNAPKIDPWISHRRDGDREPRAHDGDRVARLGEEVVRGITADDFVAFRFDIHNRDFALQVHVARGVRKTLGDSAMNLVEAISDRRQLRNALEVA